MRGIGQYHAIFAPGTLLIVGDHSTWRPCERTALAPLCQNTMTVMGRIAFIPVVAGSATLRRTFYLLRLMFRFSTGFSEGITKNLSVLDKGNRPIVSKEGICCGGKL
jgi:hypothetical protein